MRLYRSTRQHSFFGVTGGLHSHQGMRKVDFPNEAVGCIALAHHIALLGLSHSHK